MRWAVPGRASLIAGLIIVLSGGLLAGCGTVRQPPTRPANPTSAPRALLAEGGFEILSSAWIHAGDFEKRRQSAQDRMREMGAPDHVIEATSRATLSYWQLDLVVDEDLKEERWAYLLLKVRLADQTRVVFETPGALTFELSSQEGRLREVPDEGLIFCPGEFHDKYQDTRRGSVTFDRGFNGRPDYKDFWHLVWARLPHDCADMRVLAIRSDPERMSYLTTARQ